MSSKNGCAFGAKKEDLNQLDGKWEFLWKKGIWGWVQWKAKVQCNYRGKRLNLKQIGWMMCGNFLKRVEIKFIQKRLKYFKEVKKQCSLGVF